MNVLIHTCTLHDTVFSRCGFTALGELTLLPVLFSIILPDLSHGSTTSFFESPIKFSSEGILRESSLYHAVGNKFGRFREGFGIN